MSMGATRLIPQDSSFGLGSTKIGLDKGGRLNAIDSVLNTAEKKINEPVWFVEFPEL